LINHQAKAPLVLCTYMVWNIHVYMGACVKSWSPTRLNLLLISSIVSQACMQVDATRSICTQSPLCALTSSNAYMLSWVCIFCNWPSKFALECQKKKLHWASYIWFYDLFRVNVWGLIITCCELKYNFLLVCYTINQNSS
jgi:hypothetical protein